MNEFIQRIIVLFNLVPNVNKMGFLSSFFRWTPDSITNSEFFDMDTVVSNEKIAPVVRDLSTGAVVVVKDQFTNNKVRFPTIALTEPTQINELMQRQPGENPADVNVSNWLGRLARILIASFAKLSRMVRYSIELQASQVMQTGKLNLTDEKGNAVYELDFGATVSHFPAVSVSWSEANADPISDITALADLLRTDGFVDIENLVFGAAAWNNLMKSEQVKEMFKADGLGLGVLSPEIRNKGGKYMGYLNVGSYRFDLWVYNGRYENFDSNKKNKFINDDNVIFLPSLPNLDFRRLFGGIPQFPQNSIVNQILPLETGIAVQDEYHFRPRVIADEKNEVYFAELKSRPLMFPAAINSFGCLKTKA